MEYRYRKSKEEYYLGIAAEVAKRSTCLRRCYGAVIVTDDEIISTGYNGAPRGMTNCCSCGYCTRETLGIAQGERYELCKAVHAEANAIISASRKDMLDGVLYFSGYDAKTGEIITSEPCKMCIKLIINAGIKTVVERQADGSYKELSIRNIVLQDSLGLGD